MFLLCLIAALSGTPLRQAEAAEDFARSLGEMTQGHVLEAIDGGVGDDSDASILKAGPDAHSLTAMVSVLMETVEVQLSPVSSLPNIGDRRRAEVSSPPPASGDRRFAWLQCFLF
jgi:hypothetical protein